MSEMRAIILGTQSFIDGGAKVGSQYLAHALAAAGWQVDYVPTLSSPVDVVGRQRHARLARAWWGGRAAVECAPGLTEWSLRAPYPAHRLFLRHAWQVPTYGCLLPERLRRVRFDVSVTDVAPNMLLLHQIEAKVHVCRLNDWPWGFARDLHPVVMGALEAMLGGSRFDETWAVSQPLHAYAAGLCRKGVVVSLPNGVDDVLLPAETADSSVPIRQPRSAVYVGGMTAWLDADLLMLVARLMPDWTFNIYGPGGRPASDDPPNLHWCGPIGRDALPGVLQRHEVGMIPFRDADDRMRFVERPLKFYEYIAAGLGVASTDFGALRQGMGNLATYGNGAQGFAQAVRDAQAQGHGMTPEFTRSFVIENSWATRTRQMRERLEALLA